MTASPLSKYVLKVLCTNHGSLDYSDLCQKIRDQFRLPDDRVIGLPNDGRFMVIEGKVASSYDNPLPKNSRRVLAVTTLRLCKRFYSKDGCLDTRCHNLHLCRFFVYGICKFDKGRVRCNYSHEFHSKHNAALLKANDLSELDDDDLRVLLLQNDPSVLPVACQHYNKGMGYYGSCTFKEKCSKLHICQHFLHGACKYGDKCKRFHYLDRNAINMLEEQGLGPTLIVNLLTIYQNNYEINNPKRAESKDVMPSIQQLSIKSSTESDNEEICLYHITKFCSFKEKCVKNHYSLPYRWQVFKDSKWEDLTNDEQIENEYCDPNNNGSATSYIDFQKMTCDSYRVRRLSTSSSVTKPPHFILTTVWIWYWKDEFNKWIEYGSQAEKHHASTVSSSDLEKAYQENDDGILSFQAGKYEYELRFKETVQENKQIKTQREVRRRPKFVSAQDMEIIKTRGATSVRTVPANWDSSAVSEVGYKLITLPASSEEYSKVTKLFQQTMHTRTIKKILRIQNISLWEVFQWQKEQMKKRNSGKDVDERLLFHGTEKSIVDAICQQNFDWRICGTHGTLYGKGSYFARDASYSEKYSSSSSSSRIMFVARVLVGQFAKGSENYLRPPSKDGTPSNLYDSCVDSKSNPSIFVIFEKHQIYPEYLIKYCDDATASQVHIPRSSITQPLGPSLRTSHISGRSSATSYLSAGTSRTQTGSSAVKPDWISLLNKYRR
ncbi:protein mono-ADP-ribosyltransferase PARP12-like [Protopterus annectens]|uniref:protein mono-ADP-ribosyltransferase PARP12-like n=1 Tax=Protopterus annectens TaxID=7888 RepID=UPI001CF93967|nr:protein mono-ADP-ribosyltransferase PARP12-like [Protopterus annectens]